MMTILIIIAQMFLLYFGPRLIGMGRCADCSRGCAPWDAFCREHQP